MYAIFPYELRKGSRYRQSIEEHRRGAVGVGQNAGGSILSNRGSVVAEPRTNQLFVTDIPSRLIQVQELISKLDIPVRQVLIEARIVEADDKFGRSLGVRLGGADVRGVRGGDPGYSVLGGNRVAVGTLTIKYQDLRGKVPVALLKLSVIKQMRRAVHFLIWQRLALMV